MNRIKEIDAADFVAVVEPGVITGELQSAVRREGLYPPDPASLQHCSIGGNIATNAGGPRCLKYGVTRHYVLGLEVVLANGAIVRCGGRTHKTRPALISLVSLLVRKAYWELSARRPYACCPFHRRGRCSLPVFATCAQPRRQFERCLLPGSFRLLWRSPIVSPSRPLGNFVLAIHSHPEMRTCSLKDGQRESVHAEARSIARLLRAEKATAIERAT